MYIIEYNPLAKGEEGFEKNMTLGARFQNFKREPYYQQGLNSQRDRRELNSQRGQILEGYHIFLQTCYFCDNIVINYSYHYVYSNIFDIAEYVTQNNHGSIQSYNHQMLFWQEGLYCLLFELFSTCRGMMQDFVRLFV